MFISGSGNQGVKLTEVLLKGWLSLRQPVLLRAFLSNSLALWHMASPPVGARKLPLV